MNKRLDIDRNSPGNEDHHYKGEYEPIDFNENWRLGFSEGCIVKYVSRHKDKEGIKDVKKVIWYLAVVKARFRDGTFQKLAQKGSITIAEYIEAQQLGNLEANIFNSLMDTLLYGQENRLDDAVNWAVDLVQWYERTDMEADEAFGEDDPRKLKLIEDEIFDARPSPQGAPHPTRFHLDDERIGKTVRFQIEDQHGYFTVNTFADGSPGEVFVRLGKEGAEMHGFADMWAIAVSMLLQYGVDPRKIYKKFKHQQFEPAGLTGVRKVTFCKSIPDLVMKWMEKSLIPTRRGEGDTAYENAIEMAVTEQ